MPRKILLITDIGSDIDDVWCFLALAHLQEQRHLRIVGIVTTGGNVSARAMIARRWARALSLVDEALIVHGAEDLRPNLHVAGFLAEDHPAASHSGDTHRNSSDFIFDVLREHGPEKVTIMAIGALTPLAAALTAATVESNNATVRIKALADGGHFPEIDYSNLQLLQSLHCLAIQAQAVQNKGDLLIPDVENAFNLRDDKEAAHTVFNQLSTHVPFVLIGKHAAYRVPIWQCDLERLDMACPEAHLQRLVRTTLLSFFHDSRSKFAAVYPQAELLLAEGGMGAEAVDGGGGRGDGWFKMVDPCCYTYDPLVAVYLVMPHLFTAQSDLSGRHMFVGNDAEHDGVPCPELVHEELLTMMLASLRRARFPDVPCSF